MSWLIWKDPDAGKDWREEEKGTTEDEMVGWHHWLDGHDFEQAPGVGDEQGSLASCSPWGQKELDMAEWPNWTDFSAINVGTALGKFQTVSMVLRADSKGNSAHTWDRTAKRRGCHRGFPLADGRKGTCKILRGEKTWGEEWKLDLRNLTLYFRESRTPWCSLKQHPCCLWWTLS